MSDDYCRVPAGPIDVELRISVDPSRVIPEIIIGAFRHSLSFNKWLPSDAVRLQAQFAPALIEAIAVTTGLTVTVAPAPTE